MFRILLVLGGLVLVTGGLIAVLARMNVVRVNQQVGGGTVAKVLQGNSNSSSPTSSDNFGANKLPDEPPITKKDLLSVLEASVSALNKRIDDLASKQSNLPVSALDSTAATPAPSASFTGPKSIYIPVGYGGSATSSTGFADLAGQEITIDPASYPGYTQMYFEVSARIFQGNGTAQIRLGNETDGTSILNSTVSTTSGDYTELTSTGFTLPGKKKYIIQAKSTTGYSVDLQLSRIRVDF